MQTFSKSLNKFTAFISSLPHVSHTHPTMSPLTISKEEFDEFCTILRGYTLEWNEDLTVDDCFYNGKPYVRGSLSSACKLGNVKMLEALLKNKSEDSVFKSVDISDLVLPRQSCSEDEIRETLRFMMKHGNDLRNTVWNILTSEREDLYRILLSFDREEVDKVINDNRHEWSFQFVKLLHEQGRLTKDNACWLMHKSYMRDWVMENFYPGALTNVVLSPEAKLNAALKGCDSETFYLTCRAADLVSIQFLLDNCTRVSVKDIDLKRLACSCPRVPLQVFELLHSHFSFKLSDIQSNNHELLKTCLTENNYVVANWLIKTFYLDNPLDTLETEKLLSFADGKRMTNFITLYFVHPSHIGKLVINSGLATKRWYNTADVDEMSTRAQLLLEAIRKQDLTSMSWVIQQGSLDETHIKKALKICAKARFISGLELLYQLAPSGVNERTLCIELLGSHVTDTIVLEWIHDTCMLTTTDIKSIPRKPKTVLFFLKNAQWFHDRQLFDKPFILILLKEVADCSGSSVERDIIDFLLTEYGIEKSDITPLISRYIIRHCYDLLFFLHSKYTLTKEEALQVVQSAINVMDVEIMKQWLEAVPDISLIDVYNPQLNYTIRIPLTKIFPNYCKFEQDLIEVYYGVDKSKSFSSAIQADKLEVLQWLMKKNRVDVSHLYKNYAADIDKLSDNSSIKSYLRSHCSSTFQQVLVAFTTSKIKLGVNVDAIKFAEFITVVHQCPEKIYSPDYDDILKKLQ